MTRLIHDVTHLCEVLGIAFSDEQTTAITAPWDRPGVIVAGAGSGKTTVMAARVVWLVGHEGVAPGSILGLTFTRKAAAELGRKVRDDLLAMADTPTVLDLLDAQGEPTVGTYNAFAGTLITEHGLRLGLETDLQLTSDATRFQRAARVIRRYREPLPNIGVQLAETIVRVLALDGALSEHLVTPDRLREHDAGVVATIDGMAAPVKPLLKARAAALERIDLSRLVEAYRDDKRFAGVMDFSDQMAGGARLAIERPEVGEMMRERFEAVMLDEYQDTSVAQRLMLQGLFAGGHAITAVGDPAQAIYGWRGASADNIARFHEHFPARDAATGVTYGLRTSRRCHPDILDVANRAAAPYYAAHPELAPLMAPEREPERPAEITAALFDTVSDESAALVDDVVAARERNSGESVAILVRTRSEMPALTAALRGRGIDAEVVGLAGLLTLPHVNDVVSLLEVVSDATANASLLRLLTGDRWRVGARDLALLGQRASALARGLAAPGTDSLDGRLSDAVSGSDPTEIISLSDALDDPGNLPYSAAARERFVEIADVVRSVRRSLGGAVADVVQLAVRRLDLDVETALLGTGAAADLASLVDVAAGFSTVGDVDTLPGFVAYLRAEEEFGNGLEVPDRARDGAVQILTIHTAKGLEWDRVFVPYVVGGSFPSSQGRDRWTSNAKGFPYPLRGDADVLPRLAEWTSKGLTALTGEYVQEALSEEVRLAYVAFTRARTALHVSGHRWGRTQKTPRKLSDFLEAVAETCRAQSRPVTQWSAEPAPDDVNPELQVTPTSWPLARPPMPRRERAADLVRRHIDEPQDVGPAEESERLAAIDRELQALRARAASADGPMEVPVPASLSATAAMALVDDPQEFARSLVRPVPRQPSAAARLGTRFHAWVETHFGQQPLLDPSELPGRADSGLETDAELAEVVERFLTGPYADAVAHAIEAPFSLLLGDQQIVGRIDAVFETALPDGSRGYEVVDWKTNHKATADPLQLAIYRLAWAEQRGIDPASVTAAFYYVRLGEVQRHDDLPDRDELGRRLGLA
ncbi:ATP-dependent DNA helicase [Aeromicrobium sp. A1-2]|uniref:UvrD-helicase domain-containing protein n=1 Tax=Aeromicrobium sp. A1-2 TaxID=2107713 RepID=UPI000E4D7014|nr:UvrD-helicase domain-containing protein [Aeromicrobium sp. A1-2]AXT84202.1 ATP-dependent DNA helicase [Aeromicrobium sp. A1-2]